MSALLLWGAAASAETPAPPEDTPPAATTAAPSPNIEVPTADAPPVTADSEAEAADAPLVGRPIGRIELSCDLSVCKNPLAKQSFIDLSGLEIGQPYSRKVLDVAERRLGKTGFFDSIRVSKELRGGSVFLTLELTGATLIRKVEFEGVDGAPFESDLRKILLYRRGRAFDDTDKEKATAQLESLVALYEREGYFGTKVSMAVRRLKGTRHLVDLVFRVKKGDELQICDVGLRGINAIPYVRARDHLLEELSPLATQLRIVPPTYTTRGFKGGQTALTRAYRRLGYFEARIVDKGVKFDMVRKCATLLVDIKEGPRWTLRFDGNEHVSATELLEELPFFDSGFVDAEEIRRAERALQKLYETRGYPFARITGKEEGGDEVERELLFEVKEGPQLEIREVKIHGNEHIPSADLRRELGTQRFALFEEGGYLQTDQLLADLARIEAMYHDRGYLQAVVRRFSTEIVPGGGAIRVHIFVDEGPRTTVDRIDIDGLRAATSGELLRNVNLRTGSSFAPLKLRADLSRMKQTYSAFGYPMAEIETQCRTLTNERVPCEAPALPPACVARSLEELEGRCRKVGKKGSTLTCAVTSGAPECRFSGGILEDRIRLRHVVDEGPLVNVGEILLKGNFTTKQSLIFSEVPLRRTDLLDVRQVLLGQGNLRSLNLFDSVSVEAIGLDELTAESDQSTAGLLISVEEGQYRHVETKVGFEGRELLAEERRVLLTSELQYTDRNLFGLGQGFRPKVLAAIDTLQLFELGATANELDAATSELQTLDYVVGAQLAYNHPRLLKGLTGIDRIFLTVAPFYLLDLVGVVNQQALREEWGIRVELRKELVELIERFFVKLGIEFKQAATAPPDQFASDGERVFSPRKTIGKLSPDLALDKRDSPLNPSKGYVVRVEPTLVSGDALGAGGEGFVDDAYLRLSVSTSLFLQPIRELVLAQGLRFGQVFAAANRTTPVPNEERFFLGGVRSLRGFATDSVGPLTESGSPAGGEFLLNYNAELRYPLVRRLGIFGATFFDAGLLSDCDDDSGTEISCYDDAFNGTSPLESLRTSAGVGVRWLVVDQIPVVLDYGVLLNRRSGEKFGEIHANIGYTFD